eukprot:3788913-Pleurochrysis_carterae.AAC.2
MAEARSGVSTYSSQYAELASHKNTNGLTGSEQSRMRMCGALGKREKMLFAHQHHSTLTI